MHPKSIRDEDIQAARRVVGATLDGINLRQDYLEFDFFGDVPQILLRASGKIRFSVAGRDPSELDPGLLQKASPRPGSGDLVYLCGDRCTTASLTPTGLRLGLASGSWIDLALDGANAGSVEIIGLASGQREFRHVI